MINNNNQIEVVTWRQVGSEYYLAVSISASRFEFVGYHRTSPPQQGWSCQGGEVSLQVNTLTDSPVLVFVKEFC